MTTPTEAFEAARKHLLDNRLDRDAAVRGFRWPELERFNWAKDWFDELARGNQRTALKIVHDGDTSREASASFAELSQRSTRVARFLLDRGVARGDRILMMLPNTLPLWETMLAAMKIGAVIIPATTQLTGADLADRISRGNVKHAVAEPGAAEKLSAFEHLQVKLVVGGSAKGWTPFDDARAAPAQLTAHAPTAPSDALLLYFTSGTTAKPKLVLHTHQSYPVGHLSTMYWIGLQEGDVHENISSPGWAKHAWSSFFAPWNAGATMLVHDAPRFRAARTLELLRTEGVATMCAPPTVWRMLILDDLGQKPAALRELVSAGEPLNPEVIEKVKSAWGITIRDGYGQTETTAQIGNSPGQEVRLGAMGKPMPGYSVALLDHEGKEAQEGEIALRLTPRPLGLMQGYLDDPQRTAAATAGGYYRTGDEASVDADGYF
ncbi:MAG: AMP-binding protein, partial [Myxococcales bacterium]